jgi:hypothetical protein
MADREGQGMQQPGNYRPIHLYRQGSFAVVSLEMHIHVNIQPELNTCWTN